MTDEEFEIHKAALTTKRLQKPKQLKKQTSKYWNEISTRLYNFDRDDMEVKQLQKLKKEDVLSFYEVSYHTVKAMWMKWAVLKKVFLCLGASSRIVL